MGALIDDIAIQTALAPTAVKRAVTKAVQELAVFADAPLSAELRAVAGQEGAGSPPGRARRRGRGDLATRIARELGIASDRAVEVAQVVCHSLAARLDAGSRARLHRQLPPELRQLLAPPPALAAGPAEIDRTPAAAAGTIAEGRPGSTHPLSEARPGSSHPLSESRVLPRHRW